MLKGLNIKLKFVMRTFPIYPLIGEEGSGQVNAENK